MAFIKHTGIPLNKKNSGLFWQHKKEIYLLFIQFISTRQRLWLDVFAALDTGSNFQWVFYTMGSGSAGHYGVQ